MVDARNPKLACGQFQGAFIDHGTEDEVGMRDVGEDGTSASQFYGGVDALDGLLGRMEIRSDDHIDVLDLLHGCLASGG